MAKVDFVNQLQALGYQVQELAPDFLAFEFEIPVGRFLGQKVKIAFQVGDNFPMNPPPGPHFSPHLLPITGGGGAHPYGAIHISHLLTYWHYLIRQFTANWKQNDLTVKTYLGHIKNLLATIPCESTV